MPEYGQCELCKGEYSLKETKMIGGIKYYVLKCNKCNHEVARRVD